MNLRIALEGFFLLVSLFYLVVACASPLSIIHKKSFRNFFIMKSGSVGSLSSEPFVYEGEIQIALSEQFSTLLDKTDAVF
ncbi:MAG: hypothetical protein ACP5SB_03805 [Caldisericaceae bacterium]